MYGRSATDLLVSGVKVIACGSGAFGLYNTLNGNEKFYAEVIMPCTHKLLDGEAAHRVAVSTAKVAPRRVWNHVKTAHCANLKTKFLDLHLENPIGLAAGFDKDAEVAKNLCTKSGFGFVEFGSVTPAPQPGNDKPRVFRLQEDQAVINRYGFNSVGYDGFYENLAKLNKLGEKPSTVGVNLGKNKNDPNYLDGYREGYRRFAPLADYIVINLSSPNTPGLRDLQKTHELGQILKALEKERRSSPSRGVPIILKISPDLCSEDLRSMAQIFVNSSVVDALIISNTTISRDNLKSDPELQKETGGLSGAPLRERSNAAIREMYKLTAGRVPIIGCGGVFSGEDAYAKIRSGASLVQVYTALVYQGFPVVGKIKRELSECLKRDGFTSVQDAVGADCR